MKDFAVMRQTRRAPGERLIRTNSALRDTLRAIAEVKRYDVTPVFIQPQR